MRVRTVAIISVIERSYSRVPTVCVWRLISCRGGIIDYTLLKVLPNQAASDFIRILFIHGLNDTTKALKYY